MSSTEQVPVLKRRVLGIDLGGAASRTTGFAVLAGASRPRLEAVGRQPKAASPIDAEDALLTLVDSSEPSVLAIDAPLTLPPCLTCPSYCRGPGALCELASARDMWAAGDNPVTQRPCEIELLASVGKRPLPTMQLGVLTARAVALVRRLHARGQRPCSIERQEILEVYPRATLRQLANSDERFATTGNGKLTALERQLALHALAEMIDGIEDHRAALSSDHAFDALISAYTGWLAPDGLQLPPSGFNVASGWIWFPKRSDL